MQDRRGAEDRGKRRAQFVRHRADQRLAQQLALRAHLGFRQRARHIQALQRRHRIGERVVDALAHVGKRLAGDAAEIDGDQAEIGRLRRDPADEPDIAGAVLDGALEPLVMLDPRDGGAHRLRHVVGGAGVGDAEQHHLALHQIGEMLLDGDKNLSRARRHGEAARERVEVAHLALALARNDDVLLGLAGQVRHHHGDDHEQQKIERFLGRGDLETVELREIDIAREQHAGDGGHQRRNDAEPIAGQHHRHEIEHRTAQDADIVAQHERHRGCRGDKQQRNDYAAHFAPQRCEHEIYSHLKRRPKPIEFTLERTIGRCRLGGHRFPVPAPCAARK